MAYDPHILTWEARRYQPALANRILRDLDVKGNGAVVPGTLEDVCLGKGMGLPSFVGKLARQDVDDYIAVRASPQSACLVSATCGLAILTLTRVLVVIGTSSVSIQGTN